MNAEQIAKLKEVALKAPKNPGEWPFYLRSFQAAASPAVILELIALAERALLAAAPAPIQQVPTAWCTDAHFEAWCDRHDMRKDRGDHREMFDDAASLYLTVPAAPPALAGSQVQAAGDVRDAALEDAAKAVEAEICECCLSEDEQAFAEHAANTIRNLKSKPNADCSGEPANCPDNEGYGCACDPMNKAAMREQP